MMRKFSRSFFTWLLIGGLALPLYAQKKLPQVNDETKFLEQFVGTWLGTGVSDGNKTHDEMKFAWIFNKRFLKLTYRTLEGDNYQSEGYLWFDEEKKQYEYYEFNNGRWAVRHGIGRKINNSLVFTENRPDVRLQLTFEFVKQDTLTVTEMYLREKENETFVAYTFRRQAE